MVKGKGNKMKMYRIYSRKKKNNLMIYKSPFVFSEEDAEFKCKQANKNFSNSKHTIFLSKNYTKKEIRYIYSEDISFSKLEALVKGLKNDNMPIL